MKRFIGLFIALTMFAFVSTSYAGIGVDSESYVINVSKTPVLQEGVVNVPFKSLLGKLVNESLDKTKTIQVLGAGAEANLLQEIGSLYGYNIAIIESNVKDTASYLDVADMPISSFVIADELTGVNVSIDKLLNAFYEVEKSGYQADSLSNAIALLNQFLSLFTVPFDVVQSIVSAISAGETVSTFVSTIIELLSSLSLNLTSAMQTTAVKDTQYMESLDLIMEPIGQNIIVPLMHALDSVVTPMLPGGSMPAGVTRLLMQVGFPILDAVFNTLPFLRPIAMDLMAPMVSNMH